MYSGADTCTSCDTSARPTQRELNALAKRNRKSERALRQKPTDLIAHWKLFSALLTCRHTFHGLKWHTVGATQSCDIRHISSQQLDLHMQHIYVLYIAYLFTRTSAASHFAWSHFAICTPKNNRPQTQHKYTSKLLAPYARCGNGVFRTEVQSKR